MTKKSYIDECIARAEKATEGPWITRQHLPYLDVMSGEKLVVNGTSPEDAEFIAHARTDVPELARRLKRTCEILRDQASTYSNRGPNVQHHLLDELRQLADELEAPLEDK